jgi:hypothetical protein
MTDMILILMFCWRVVDVGASSSSSSVPGNGARKRLDGWLIVDNDDYNQAVGNPKRKV